MIDSPAGRRILKRDPYGIIQNASIDRNLSPSFNIIDFQFLKKRRGKQTEALESFCVQK